MPQPERRQEDEAFTEKPPKAPQPLWVVLVIALAPNILTTVTTVVKTSAANARAEASYKATQEAVKLLQDHDAEHDRQAAAVAAHLQVVEAWLGSMHPNAQNQLVLPVPQAAPNKRTWRPNFPPQIPTPATRKIEFKPTLDDIVDDLKSGKGQYVHEVYEGPPEDAPQWTRDAKRAAAASEAK